MGDGVEKARVIERAAGEGVAVCAGQGETGTGPGVIDLILPRAKTK